MRFRLFILVFIVTLYGCGKTQNPAESTEEIPENSEIKIDSDDKEEKEDVCDKPSSECLRKPFFKKSEPVSW